MDEYEVAVIGGGSAGLCAAIAAARYGARTVLIERSHKLGGMGTQALVHTFCGLYEPDVSKPPRLANGGLAGEIEQAMRERTGQAGPTKMGKVYVLLQDPEHYHGIATEFIAQEPKLDLKFGVNCSGIRRDEGFILQGCDLRAKTLIDCSADAVAADFLGATRAIAGQTQRSAVVFSLQNVAPEAGEDSYKMRLALDLVRAVQAGRLPPELLATTTRASTVPGEIYLTIDLDDPARGAEFIDPLADFLRAESPAYARAVIAARPDRPGIRETFRWLGQYTLTADDLIEGREFDDTVAYAAWPMELRETTRGPQFRYFHQAKASPIPLKSLTSKELPNVFFAGRCLSATHEALASVRVMGTCFATGQAAGMAAAMTALGEVINPAAIRREISNRDPEGSAR